ncbi:hypothetical protein DE146DRAFT_639038 [Phaeosphaeria sp. MPI-PUGE-AT-0046c]|nr:hypothetical protein DE146DRAFT_639038 [Phaeosphaeria sp. MPI-PUGE-AT-0046c]
MRHPATYRQFCQNDGDGFAIAGRHPFDIWMTSSVRNTSVTLVRETSETPDIGYVILKANSDVHCLSLAQRRILLDKWIGEIIHDTSEQFFESIKEVEKSKRSH